MSQRANVIARASVPGGLTSSTMIRMREKVERGINIGINAKARTQPMLHPGFHLTMPCCAMLQHYAVCAMLLRDKSPTTIPIEESLIDDTSSRIEEILSTISPVVVA